MGIGMCLLGLRGGIGGRKGGVEVFMLGIRWGHGLTSVLLGSCGLRSLFLRAVSQNRINVSYGVVAGFT